MFYTDEGSGPLTLVFVHGFACSHRDWEFQRSYFQRSARVVTCDLRGHGRSASEGGVWTIDECAEDLHQLIEALDVRDAVLVGHSMGCRVALRCYLDAPRPVRALVFVDPSYLGDDEGTDVEKRPMTAPTLQTPWDDVIREMFAQMFLEESPPQYRERILKQALGTREDVSRALFFEFFRWDALNLTNALSQVRVPVLSLQSTVVDPDRIRRPMREGEDTPWIRVLLRYVPDAQIEHIAHAGHFSMLEAPEVVNASIDQFVRSNTGSYTEFPPEDG